MTHRVCTAGTESGCGVDRAVCPIRASSGLTADLTSDANQPVIALLTSQPKSSSPQPPSPGSDSASAAGDAGRDAAAGAAGSGVRRQHDAGRRDGCRRAGHPGGRRLVPRDRGHGQDGDDGEAREDGGAAAAPPAGAGAAGGAGQPHPPTREPRRATMTGARIARA